MLIADQTVFGKDLLIWLLLAMGAAMALGNLAALVRPPDAGSEHPRPAAPRGRSLAFVALGALISIWAIATLAH